MCDGQQSRPYDFVCTFDWTQVNHTPTTYHIRPPNKCLYEKERGEGLNGPWSETLHNALIEARDFIVKDNDILNTLSTDHSVCIDAILGGTSTGFKIKASVSSTSTNRT